jgi:SRSO17 transposase
MGLPRSGDVASRFSAFIDGLMSVIGHAARAKPLRDYCTGLMMPCDRKSVEPMAAITAPDRTAAQHQSLLHFVSQGDWSDQQVLAKVRDMVLPDIERHGPIEAWIIDDTGFPKKGRHSVGVARQYCGQLGKQDNCQVAVTLSLANHHASLPVAYRLYLPKEWVTDRIRRRKAGVPKEITFKTKPAIALDHLRWACAAGLPRGVVLMDAGYGTDTALRENITALGLSYVAGIQPQTSVWALGTGPRPPKKWSGSGRPPKLLRRDSEYRPISAKKLAIGLPPHAWHKITWREGTAERLSSRFARVRVRPAHRDYWLAESRPEEWLLIEWPAGEEAPTKYWLSTLPANIGFRQLVDILPSCAGALSATTTNSNRKLALVTSRGEAGVASTITQHCALPPTDFWSLSERRFPPQKQPPPSSSRKLQFPRLIGRGDPPLRPERHVPNSIASIRRRLNAALVSTLSRCPCCIRPIASRSRYQNL